MRDLFKSLGLIQWFALLSVAITSLFFGYLAYWLIGILSSPDWCGRAIKADKIVASNSFSGLTACMDLLKMQVGSLSNALLIVIGTFAACLGVLVIIVVAGAHFAGKLLGKIEFDIDRSK